MINWGGVLWVMHGVANGWHRQGVTRLSSGVVPASAAATNPALPWQLVVLSNRYQPPGTLRPPPPDPLVELWVGNLCGEATRVSLRRAFEL